MDVCLLVLNRNLRDLTENGGNCSFGKAVGTLRGFQSHIPKSFLFEHLLIISETLRKILNFKFNTFRVNFQLTASV